MNETPQETETIEVTHTIMHAVLKMTSDPDAYTEKTKRFVRVLHRAELSNSSHWRLVLTEEDMETMVVMLRGFCLNRPKHLTTRFHNYLYHTSELYRRVYSKKQGVAA